MVSLAREVLIAMAGLLLGLQELLLLMVPFELLAQSEPRLVVVPAVQLHVLPMVSHVLLEPHVLVVQLEPLELEMLLAL